METIYHLDSIIKDRKKEYTVEELINKNKSKIFSFIKNGYIFDDDVLAKANITKTIRDVAVYNEIVTHEKDNKVYQKDRATMKTILKSLNIESDDELEIIDDEENFDICDTQE